MNWIATKTAKYVSKTHPWLFFVRMVPRKLVCGWKLGLDDLFVRHFAIEPKLGGWEKKRDTSRAKNREKNYMIPLQRNKTTEVGQIV